jgi:predicted DNA-binding transcriptional regulator YafY
MQGSRLGVSLSDIEAQFGVGRRTAQRLRDAVVRVYPRFEQLVDAEARPRWRISATGVVTPGALAADDIADPEATARYLRQRNLRKRTAVLERIASKLKAALPGRHAHRSSPASRRCLKPRGWPCGAARGR